MPQKEASANKDFQQCERCNYSDQCNPFFIDAVPAGSVISLFDIESSLLDTFQKKKAILVELGLSPSTRLSDIHDDSVKERYWELLASPRFVESDTLMENGREKVATEVGLGRIPVGISSARGEVLLEPTKARLANLGAPIAHLIVRERGNYDTDGKFKAKWAVRLSINYEIAEYFDRDAVTSSAIMKIAEDSRNERNNQKGIWIERN